MAKNEKTLNEKEMRNFLRSKTQRLVKLPNVTSVGVGYKIKGGKRTNQLCIQVTVGKKVSLEALGAEGLEALPESIPTDDGIKVPLDVIERSFEPNYVIVSDPEAEAVAEELSPWQKRRSRLDAVTPGCSVSHVDGTAGTLGAIVYDNEAGQPFMLSNWHVLHGPTGKNGDTVVQPGPYDNGNIEENKAGMLIRSHLGLAGDCAIACTKWRDFDEEIIELGVQPRRIAKVNLNDKVVKSGRTTGVTYGIVQRVDVVANINYGGTTGVKQIGGFEIGPNSGKPPANGEVSMGGDSGSLWLIDGDDDENDIAVGLHFAGETNPDPAAEHALACNIHSVLDKLNVSFVEKDPIILDDEDMWNELIALINMLWMRMQGLEQNRYRQLGDAGDSNGKPATAQPSDGERPAIQEGLPVYGNWCGPGHGGGTPIDDLDRACMMHDLCYDKKGYFNCECDTKLIRDIDRALRYGNVRPLGRIMGPIIRNWFMAQPCVHHVGGIPIPGGGTGGTTRVARGVATGVKRVVRKGKKAWKKIKSWF